jgi:Bacterial regulatory proteins, luxR family
MANRDDRVAQLRAAADSWLRSPRLWRGLLVAGLVVGGFIWATIVLGIALTMAQEGAQQWWMVLLFGLATLELVIGGGYLLAMRLFGGAARPPVREPARAPDATGTVKAHLNNIFRKLEARSRLEAVTRARDLRLLTEHDPK